MFCRRCGTQLDEGAAFCPRCGVAAAPLTGQVASPIAPPWPTEEVSPKSRLAVSLLAAFLGGFGAHRFYMGKIGSAVGMLLLGLSPASCMVGWIVVAAISDPEAENPPPAFWVFLVLMYVLAFAIGIWALIDFIIAVTGNFKDKEGKPVRKW